MIITDCVCGYRYSVILMDMVYQMLKETYHIKKKMVTLTRNVLISLATVIISNSLNTPHPEVSSLTLSCLHSITISLSFVSVGLAGEGRDGEVVWYFVRAASSVPADTMA